MLEANGQLDLFVNFAPARRRHSSPSLSSFKQRILSEFGVTFAEWVTGCLSRGLTTRQMASQVGGVYHSTIWRWAKREIPGIEFPDKFVRVSDDEVRQVVSAWRDDGIITGKAISERIGVPIEKVKLAKRVWHRKSQEQGKALARAMASSAWVRPSEDPVKRRTRFRIR